MAASGSGERVQLRLGEAKKQRVPGRLGDERNPAHGKQLYGCRVEQTMRVRSVHMQALPAVLSSGRAMRVKSALTSFLLLPLLCIPCSTNERRGLHAVSHILTCRNASLGIQCPAHPSSLRPFGFPPSGTYRAGIYMLLPQWLHLWWPRLVPGSQQWRSDTARAVTQLRQTTILHFP